MADRGENNGFIFWDAYGVNKIPFAGINHGGSGSLYNPDKVTCDAFRKKPCIRAWYNNNKEIFIPLVESGGSVASLEMRIGDKMYRHFASERSYACRLNGKTLFAPQESVTIRVNDTYTWDEDFTNIDEDFFVFDDKILNVGELEIEYHLYKNGVEVPYFYITNDELDVLFNGSYIDCYSFNRAGYLKIEYSNNVFSIFDNSHQITQINATGDNRLGLRFTGIDTDEVDEIRVSYTWKWK